MRIFHYIIATAMGSGFFPLLPGTIGSAVGLAIFWFIPLGLVGQLILIVFIFLLGVWSSTQVEKERGEDPSIVVIDEVVGQWVALLFIPGQIIWFLLSFILFRLFDILKPFPIDQSQALRGGWGVMTDDILAGLYANVILQIIIFFGSRLII